MSISVTPAATDRTAAFYTIKQEGAGHLEFITTCLSCLSSFSFLMRLTVVKIFHFLFVAQKHFGRSSVQRNDCSLL